LERSSRFWGFKASDRNLPVVYALIRGEQTLYIGRCYLGLSRVFEINHPALMQALPDDDIAVWVLSSREDAVRVEKQLIAGLQPPLNSKGTFRERTRARKKS